MPPLRDFLSRFRPAGAPGAAARAGMPVDRERELAAEVGPVLALLDGTERECALVVARARHDADEIMAGARAEAAAIAADGARRGSAARDEAGRRLTEAAAADAAAMVAAARRQADQVRALAARRVPGLADLAAGQLRQLLTAARSPGGER